MAAAELVALAFGALLAVTHYAGERMDSGEWEHEARLTSFAAGATGAYAFLQLLPEHFRGVEVLGETGFFFSLSGFLLIHVAELFIQRYEREPAEVAHDFKELHTAFLFLYYLAIGIVIADLTLASPLEGLLFFVPVSLHTAISSMALTELHEDVLDLAWVKAAVSGATLVGAAIAVTVAVPPTVFHALLGLITGMFLYVVIHDSLPAPGESAPYAFLAGTGFYSLVIVATWVLV